MIEFGRAWALLLLIVPPLVVWIAARASRGRLRPTGTLEVWREIGALEARNSEQRRKLPPALWLLATALVFGVFALADPRPRGAHADARWRVVIDRSPSMYLPLGSESRLAVALRGASDLLRGAQVEWIAASGDFAVSSHAPSVPSAWLTEPRGPWSEPRWDLYDAPGTLWITDVDPAASSRPVHASVQTSGGPAVPGLVAQVGTTRVSWNGRELVRTTSEPGAARSVAIDVSVRATPIGRAAEIWAKTRGFVTLDESPDAALRLISIPREGSEVRTLEFGSDGWSLSCDVVEFGELPREPWQAVVVAEGRDVVRARAGVLELACASCDEPRGDPAEFALFWAKLFDATVLPPDGISAAERASAGDAVRHVGAEPLEGAGRVDRRAASLCALLAALFAAASLAVRR